MAQKSEKPKLNADQMRQIGENYLAAGDTGLALQHLTMAEQKKPGDPVIQYDLGMAYWARGMPGEAIAKFEKALALKPDYAESSNALGALYAQQGDYSKAEAELQKAVANPFYQTPYFALYNLGMVDEKRGDPKAALEKYERAVRMQQAYAAPYLRMGIIREQMGDSSAALQNYKKAIQYNPKLAEAMLRIGLLHYRTRDFVAAREALSQVGRISPDSNFALEAQQYLDKMPAGSKPVAQ
jgi:Tfp pilus assembly protein PilF